MKGNHLNYVKKKRLSRNLSSPEWNSPQQPGSCKRTRCRAAQYLTFPSQKWRVVLRKFSSLPDSWSDKSSGVSLQEAVLNVGEQPLSSIFSADPNHLKRYKLGALSCLSRLHKRYLQLPGRPLNGGGFQMRTCHFEHVERADMNHHVRIA